MRGHGAVNTRCAVEVGLDEMAEQMQVDPIDLRLANLLPPHSRTISGFNKKWLRVFLYRLGPGAGRAQNQNRKVVGHFWKKGVNFMALSIRFSMTCCSLFWSPFTNLGVDLSILNIISITFHYIYI